MFVSLLLGTTSVFAAGFPDVSETTPYYNSILWAQSQDIITGYMNGNFGPDDCVRRAEIVKIVFETLQIDVNSSDAPLFPDTAENSWYTPYIKTARARGTIEGYPDGTFRPMDCVNRVEAIKVATLEFNNGNVTSDSYSGESLRMGSFVDVDKNGWYYDLFRYAINSNIVGLNHVRSQANPNSLYYGIDQYFEPGGEMSRKEVAEMVYRLKTIKDNNVPVYFENSEDSQTSETNGINDQISSTDELDTTTGTNDITTVSSCQNSETKPVCATNGTTYQNLCEAQTNNQVIAYYGSCIDMAYSIGSSTYSHSHFGNFNTYLIDTGNISYHFDKELFESEESKNEHIDATIKADKLSYDFLVNNFEFSPACNRIVIASLYTPGEGGYASAAPCLITNYYNDKIKKQTSYVIEYGNTHEFVHIFLWNTNVVKTWFEEGLANFMSNYQRNGEENGSILEASGLLCKENSWEQGGTNSFGVFESNSGDVAYSDFTIPAETSVPFYSPLNRSSYYMSAQCLWGYIQEAYGIDKMNQTVNEWNRYRDTSVSAKKLIRDIVNPILNADLSSLVQNRYNYIEN